MKNVSMKSILRGIEKKLPQEWTMRPNDEYPVSFDGWELDVLWTVIDAFKKTEVK